MCEVIKFGLMHDGFLVDMGRAIKTVPQNFDSGFILHLDINKWVFTDRNGKEKKGKGSLLLWLPNMRSLIICGEKVIIEGNFSNNFRPYMKYDYEYLEMDARDINAFELEYDDSLAEYNGECIDEETGVKIAESR